MKNDPYNKLAAATGVPPQAPGSAFCGATLAFALPDGLEEEGPFGPRMPHALVEQLLGLFPFGAAKFDYATPTTPARVLVDVSMPTAEVIEEIRSALDAALQNH